MEAMYTTEEAANLLRLSRRTLEKMRLTGCGPCYRKFGSRVLYPLSELDAWVDEKRRRSTSDSGVSKSGGRRG